MPFGHIDLHQPPFVDGQLDRSELQLVECLEHRLNGEIVINLSVDAVRNLHIGNEEITCGGRFGGVAHGLVVPIVAVRGIFAKETGQGLMFQGNGSILTLSMDSGITASPDKSDPPGKPKLRIVK